MATLLSHGQIKKFLAEHPGWSLEEKQLHRCFELPSFVEAIAFVNRIAQVAEGVNHHPDIAVRDRKVEVKLTTHDEGGLTALDPMVAAECDRAFDQPLAQTQPAR